MWEHLAGVVFSSDKLASCDHLTASWRDKKGKYSNGPLSLSAIGGSIFREGGGASILAPYPRSIIWSVRSRPLPFSSSLDVLEFAL
jgi:hypothetical protein